MTLHRQGSGAVLAAFALAAAGFMAAGWVAGAAGLDELRPLAQAGGAFLAVSRADALLSRWAGRG